MHISKTLGGFDFSEKERFVLAFALASVIQALFLRKEQSGELFGFDVNVKEQRDAVLDIIISRLFGGDVFGRHVNARNDIVPIIRLCR